MRTKAKGIQIKHDIKKEAHTRMPQLPFSVLCFRVFSFITDTLWTDADEESTILASQTGVL